MPAQRSYYDILSVPRNADADALRAAHRRLARELHPDVNKAPDAAQRFAEVQEAYDVLSDDTKRKLYDQIGHERFVNGGAAAGGGAPGGGSPFGGRGRGPRQQTYTWTNIGGDAGANPFDAEDIGSVFEEVFGGGRSRGGQWGGDPFAGGRQKARRKGRDAEHEISIPFDLALSGGAYTLRLSFGDEDAETIEVRIPKAVADGARLRLRGKGQPSPAGERGDLLLTIKVAAHPFYRREGDQGLDIVADLPISITEASLGAKVPVRTPGGVVDVSIPAGTASGSRLRLRGRGAETQEGRKGDFYALVKIVPPKNLSDADQQALRELGERAAPPGGDARA